MDPQNPYSHLALGLPLRKQKDHVGGLPNPEAGRTGDKEEILARFDVVCSDLSKVGDWDGVIAQYREWVRLEPKHDVHGYSWLPLGAEAT